MSNLKVNSKSSVLEHKRKHNLLVDSVENDVKEYAVDNIENLSDEILNKLRVGDVIQKKTGNQRHCYTVTYKEENHGICMSYFDAGYLETVSYDYTNSHWVFNSKDAVELNPTGIANALENQDVKVRTLSQNSANYELNLEFYEPTGLKMYPIYSKLKIVNGIIHIVTCLKIKNETESAVNFQSIYGVYVNIPEDVRKLIYDIDGKTLDENPTSTNTFIQIRTAVGILNSIIASGNNVIYMKIGRYNNQIGVNLSTASSISISAGDSKIIQGYTALIAI